MKQFAVRITTALGCAALTVLGGQWIANAQEQAAEPPAAPADATAPAAEEKPEPNVANGDQVAVLDAHQVMSLFVDPFFVKIQEGLAQEPDRRGWRTVRESALASAESANLLFLYVPAEGGDDWKTMTVEMRVASYELYKTVKATDYEGSKAKYLTLVESCNKCHQRFEPETAPKIEP
ncbi:MAG: hypothetical protein AMXMBFR84_44140 [Candidatus Hydrogenedentota bacterium]